MTTDLHAQLRALQLQFSTLQAAHIALLARTHQQEMQAHEQFDRLARKDAREALDLGKAADLQQVFYRVAERATAGLSLRDFLQSGHQLLSELMYAKNCHVCRYEASTQTLDFPYYVDEREGNTVPRAHLPVRRGLTEYVMRSGQPQLVSARRLQLLQASGEVTQVRGVTDFSSWLGVPLQTHGKITGVLALKSYDVAIRYTQADAEMLSFVASQIGSALERYEALEALRQSEERYRCVVENVGVGVLVVQDDRIMFANPSLVRMVGHPLDQLLSQPFTATMHPDDVANILVRQRRHLRGESGEQLLSVRVITGHGEVRTLELSAVRIEWNKRAATLTFAVDATARFDAELAQRMAMQRQRELNDMKARFIATTSHEFRTPLATIHSSTELLRHYDGRMPADKRVATLQKIDDAVERMTHMLENVMLIGRSAAGQLEFQPRTLRVAPLCRALVEELHTAMAVQARALHWRVELPADEDEFALDSALMRNIVLNLLSNAVKYSPAGGTVSLCVRADSAHLEIVVSDQGIGIPPPDLPRLFESFHRAANVGTISGTGLGLFIVKEAVTMHQGSILVHSEIGKGSTFTVSLPLHSCNQPGTAP